MPFNKPNEVLFLKLAGSDFRQAAYYPSDHLPQKVRCFDPKLDDLVIRFYFRTFDHHHSRYVRTRRIRRTEADEIVATDKQCCGSGHGLNVQRLLDPPYGLLCERLLPRGDLIDVTSRNRVVTCMKVPRRTDHIQDDDICGKQFIETPTQRLGRVSYRPLELDVSNLPQGMNPRIRPPCALHLDFAVQYGLCNSAQLSHHRTGIFLFLPTAVS